MKLALFACTLTIVLALSGAVIRDFPCAPKPDGVATFDVTQYLGIWYEQAVLPYHWEAPGNECTRAEYIYLGNGIVGVHNSDYSADNALYEEACGTAYELDSVNAPGELVVGFPEASGSISNYWVLDTDYTTFTSVYFCLDLPNNRSDEFAWALTRETNPPTSVLHQALEAFETNGISLNGLLLTWHPDDCAYDVSPNCSDDWFETTTLSD